MEELRSLKALYEDGYVIESEYNRRRVELINQITGKNYTLEDILRAENKTKQPSPTTTSAAPVDNTNATPIANTNSTNMSQNVPVNSQYVNPIQQRQPMSTLPTAQPVASPTNVTASPHSSFGSNGSFNSQHSGPSNPQSFDAVDPFIAADLTLEEIPADQAEIWDDLDNLSLNNGPMGPSDTPSKEGSTGKLTPTPVVGPPQARGSTPVSVSPSNRAALKSNNAPTTLKATNEFNPAQAGAAAGGGTLKPTNEFNPTQATNAAVGTLKPTNAFDQGTLRATPAAGANSANISTLRGNASAPGELRQPASVNTLNVMTSDSSQPSGINTSNSMYANQMAGQMGMQGGQMPGQMGIYTGNSMYGNPMMGQMGMQGGQMPGQMGINTSNSMYGNPMMGQMGMQGGMYPGQMGMQGNPMYGNQMMGMYGNQMQGQMPGQGGQMPMQGGQMPMQGNTMYGNQMQGQMPGQMGINTSNSMYGNPQGQAGSRGNTIRATMNAAPSEFCNVPSLESNAMTAKPSSRELLNQMKGTKNENIETYTWEFFHAAANNNVKRLNELLELGVHINQADTDTGNTALHMACTKGQKHAIFFLVDQGADIEAQNKKGSTPLHLLVTHRFNTLVTWLVKQGADITTEDARGFTPYDMALPWLQKEMKEAVYGRQRSQRTQQQINRTFGALSEELNPELQKEVNFNKMQELGVNWDTIRDKQNVAAPSAAMAPAPGKFF